MDDIDKAIALLRESPAAFLTTIDDTGVPRTRAMLNLRRPKDFPSLVSFFEGHRNDLAIYFTTNTSSDKVKQICKNAMASVYYCRSREWRGLNLSGSVEVVDDRELKEYFWQDSWSMYYPLGVSDPDYALLCLMPTLAVGYHKMERYRIELDGSHG